MESVSILILKSGNYVGVKKLFSNKALLDIELISSKFIIKTKVMKNILLLTDFSKNAFDALTYALHLFEAEKCNFYILNVQKPSGYITADLIHASTTESVYNHMINSHQEQLKEVVKQLKIMDEHQQHSFTPLVTFDDFTHAVNKTLKTHSIELVIMGTSGASGTEEVIFGSNTLQVIRHIKCPTITIPKDFKYQPLKNLMFCMAYQKQFKERSVQILKELLKLYDPELHLIEINNKAEFLKKESSKERLLEKFKDFNCHYYFIDQLPMWMIVQTATQLLRTDINAVFVERESFFERLFSNSEMAYISHSKKVPLLFLTP